MNVSLTPELEKLVLAKVESGRYHSVGEVVKEALLLLERDDDLQEIHLQELRSRIDQGLVSSAKSASVEGERFMQSLLGDLDSQIKPNS